MNQPTPTEIRRPTLLENQFFAAIHADMKAGEFVNTIDLSQLEPDVKERGALVAARIGSSDLFNLLTDNGSVDLVRLSEDGQTCRQLAEHGNREMKEVRGYGEILKKIDSVLGQPA